MAPGLSYLQNRRLAILDGDASERRVGRLVGDRITALKSPKGLFLLAPESCREESENPSGLFMHTGERGHAGGTFGRSVCWWRPSWSLTAGPPPKVQKRIGLFSERLHPRCRRALSPPVKGHFLVQELLIGYQRRPGCRAGPYRFQRSDPLTLSFTQKRQNILSRL